ncbi:hypothetical protein M407DRAFT_6000 [Tulasnella calospora MUT 4182]|uniref:Uncharacterized protein n=1 Tax=Tulasnella calospora MUT 4182 TaxID=1051891 RepID=A0A0C3QNL8_9AGAM|nr:hypothetical protein M407DRAFT_6000 [Tulasnella calospora MUT 4182]
MLFRAPTVLAVAFFAGFVLAKKCQPGEYRDANGDCQNCADGSISPLRIHASLVLPVKAPILRIRNAKSALRERTTTSQVVSAVIAKLATSTTYQVQRAAANVALASTPTTPGRTATNAPPLSRTLSPDRTRTMIARNRTNEPLNPILLTLATW